MIGEVGLAEHMEAGNVAHEIVIYPEPPHRVVESGIDPHGALVGILSGDVFIHLKEVAVAFTHCLFTEPLDGICKVEINPETAWAHA